MKPAAPTGHESFCLENAARFAAIRGRSPAQRTRTEFATLAEAEAYAAIFADGRTMIYAITAIGHSAHIRNA